MSVADIDALKARIAPHVFASQYQQRPTTGGSGYCSIDRLVRYAEAPPFELIVHSWDIAGTKGGGDWTVCAKFGLAKDPDGRDILYLIGIVRMQIELPDVSEAIVSLDEIEKPALIVMDGNGIGRGIVQDLGQRQFKHVLPGADMERGCSDTSKLRRFNEGLFHPYDCLVRFAERDAWAGGSPCRNRRLSGRQARRPSRRVELRRGLPRTGHPRRSPQGLTLGRVVTPPARVQIIPPKSRDQELYDRRRSRQD